jgi:hypothetical protein
VDDQILDELNPPTKVLGKILKTWGEREESRTHYAHTGLTSSVMELGNTAEVALNLSKRLIAVVKVRNMINIETGLEMLALAIAISTEVRNTVVFYICSSIFFTQNNGMFPEMVSDLKDVLSRIWSDRIDPQQLHDVTNGIQSLHKLMKNLFEIVFAASPLLVLSTHGWDWQSYNSIFLFRVCVVFELFPSIFKPSNRSSSPLVMIAPKF